MSEADTVPSSPFLDVDFTHESLFPAEPSVDVAAVYSAAHAPAHVPADLDVSDCVRALIEEPEDFPEESEHPEKRRKTCAEFEELEAAESMDEEYDEEVLPAETSEEQHVKQLQQLRGEIELLDGGMRELFLQSLFRLCHAEAPDGDHSALAPALRGKVLAAANAAAAAAGGGKRRAGAREAAAGEEIEATLGAIERTVLRVVYLVDTEHAPVLPPPPPPAVEPPPPPASAASPQPAAVGPQGARRRVFFTEEQTRKLNGFFGELNGSKCSPGEISAIAADVGISDHQVRIYFQNKRARSRGKPDARDARRRPSCHSPASSAPSSPAPSPVTSRPSPPRTALPPPLARPLSVRA